MAPLLDNSNAQTGDHQIGSAAGHDINNVGMDPGEALAFVRDYLFSADQIRERSRREHRAQLDRVTLFLGIVGTLLAVQTLAMLSLMLFFSVLLYPRLVSGF